jgi:hypothetical protein
LLCEFIEGALVSGELIWRDAKHETLDGEVRREVLGIPVENTGGGFSDGVQGLVVIDDMLAWHIAQGLGSGDNGFGEVEFGFAVRLGDEVLASLKCTLGASEDIPWNVRFTAVAMGFGDIPFVAFGSGQSGVGINAEAASNIADGKT